MTQADKYISCPISPNFFVSQQLPYDLTARALATGLLDPAISMDMQPHHHQQRSTAQQFQSIVYPNSARLPIQTDLVQFSVKPMSIKKEPLKESPQQPHPQQFNPMAHPAQHHIMPAPYTHHPSRMTIPLPTPRVIQPSSRATASAPPPPPPPPPHQSRVQNRSSSARVKFQCHLCTSTFSRKDNLKTHHRLHSGEMPFQCQYCGRKFRWQSSARTHEQVHERHGHRRMNPPPQKSPSASSSSAPSAAAPAPASAGVPHATTIARPMPSAPAGAFGPGALRAAGDGSRRRRPASEIQMRPIQKRSAHPNIVIDLDGIFGEVGPLGAALQADVATPQTQAPGESPMFSLPKLSQQDLERCLEQKPDAQ